MKLTGTGSYAWSSVYTPPAAPAAAAKPPQKEEKAASTDNKGLLLLETGGGNPSSAANLASSVSGSTVFASSADKGTTEKNATDGLYSGDSVWAPNATKPKDNKHFLGVKFGKGEALIHGVAWSRDNGKPQAKHRDRFMGTYIVQVTKASFPNKNTPDSQWTEVGRVVYTDSTPAQGWARHRYRLTPPVSCTGVRLVVDAGVSIDQLEVWEDVMSEGAAVASAGAGAGAATAAAAAVAAGASAGESETGMSVRELISLERILLGAPVRLA
jgi:hypothetical protein